MDSVENLAATLDEINQGLPVDELLAAKQQMQTAIGIIIPEAEGSFGMEAVLGHLDDASEHMANAMGHLMMTRGSIYRYLTDILAGPEPLGPLHVPDVPALPQEARTELWEGTAMTAAEVRAIFADLQEGKPVRSGATPIGAIGLTPKELALITRRDVGYRTIDASQGFLPRVIMDKDTRATVERLKAEFIALCQQDIDRGGLGFIDMNEPFLIRMGSFSSTDELRLHVDPFNRPAIRYVVSFGTTGSTIFSDMVITKNELGRAGFLKDSALERVQPFSHGTGVVSRFLGSSGVHGTPVTPGHRLFMTLTASLRD